MLLTVALWPLNERVPFAFFYIAALHVTDRAGKLAGALTSALSLIAVNFVLLEPRFGFDYREERWAEALLFMLVSTCIVLIAARLRAREQDLRQKGGRITALIDGAMDAIVISDDHQRIVSFNKAAERIFGHRAEAVVGGELSLLFPARLRGARESAPIDMLQVGSLDASRPRDAIGLRANGDEFPMEVTASRCEALDARARRKDDVNGWFSIIIVRDVSEQRRIQREVERERRFSDDLLECIPGILYLYDSAGRFLRFNKDFERASGYSAAEIMKMHPLDFFDGDDRARVEARISEVFVHGEARVEAPFLSKDGRHVPYLFTGRRASVSGADCLVGVGIDISDRLAAEAALVRSEERYRTTLDGIMESCVILDFDWRYLYVNPAATAMMQRPSSEVMGRTVFEAYPGVEKTPLFEPIARCMRDRVIVDDRVRFDLADGRATWYDLRCLPTHEGICLLSVDITERLAAERERTLLLEQQREANLSLERTVAERTADVREALAHAESADRTKSAFLATMSHELRTPLNAIIGFTSILQQGLSGALNAEQLRQLAMVEDSAHHLLALINDVLDISRIEADQIEVHVEPFDLRASIERVVALIRPLADKQGLTLGVNMAANVDGMISDRRRVEQILINLLSNAVKFTEHGGIELTVSLASSSAQASKSAPDLVRVDVRDTGIGISEGDLATLFQPFRQVDSGLSRHREGTGLGLAICGRLAAMLGGEVTVRSTPGVGSTFRVTLALFSTTIRASSKQAIASAS